MSNDAGDASGPPPDEPYELPTIVPATEPALDDTAAMPRLPSRTQHAARPATAAHPPTPPANTGSATQRVRMPASSPAAPSPAAPGTSAPAATAPTPLAAGPPLRPASTHAAPAPVQAPVAAPVSAQLRAPGRRARVRRVTRVLRHIDPWSTFKVALLFSAVAYVVALTSGVLLWRVADSTGTLANVERWFTQFGWETFELKGGEIFHNAWMIGLFGVVAATGGAVLFVTLFNLVSDIVGGIRMTVLEEEVVERTVSSTRRYVVRNAGPGAAGAAPSSGTVTWSVDDDPADDPVDDTRTPAPDGHASADSPPPAEAGTRSASPDWSVD